MYLKEWDERMLTSRTLLIFKYLWETTDEAHPISLADISAHLKEHGITADPRTLRNDIEQLGDIVVALTDEGKNTLKRLLYDHAQQNTISTWRIKR